MMGTAIGVSSSGGPSLGGYTCTCGQWVPNGISHVCTLQGTYQQPVIQYVQPWSTLPTVSKFKGSVKTFEDLPKGGHLSSHAQSGDAYYVEKPGLLVVRVANGWHHFDKD